MTDRDEIDYGSPPRLTMPEGSEEEQTAWLRARIQEGLDSGPGVLADEAFFDRIKREGRVRLESRRAA